MGGAGNLQHRLARKERRSPEYSKPLESEGEPILNGKQARRNRRRRDSSKRARNKARSSSSRQSQNQVISEPKKSGPDADVNLTAPTRVGNWGARHLRGRNDYLQKKNYTRKDYANRKR